MAVRRIQCRDHAGGIFTVQVKRGRQPVRCKPEFPCDKVGESTEPHALANAVARDEMAIRRRHAEVVSAIPAVTNPSASLAREAKARLEPLGWVCKGRAGINEDGGTWAEITCSRGDETLVLSWIGDDLANQYYMLEFTNPVDNGFPPNQLHFNPDEATDSELVRLIRGMKVTWWNTIAGATETAVPGGNITVEHMFRSNGDEDEPKRIVKFLDHNGGGFRAFHVAALLKVG